MSAVARTCRAIGLAAPALARMTPASAHGGGAESGWTFDPWLVVPLFIALGIYLYGVHQLAERSSRRPPQRLSAASLYVSGWLTLSLTLVSPFHGLGEHLFTYHMMEHEIIMAVSAPLLILSRPVGVMLWSLPHSLRLGLLGATRSRGIRASWNWLIRPVNATVIHGVAIWLWHWPALFDAAVTEVSLHRWQHISFFVTALLFWYSLVRISRSGEAVWHLFFTMLHTSVLGALIAVAPRVLYSTQTAHSLAWGLTPLEDQQLAGIFMWVPAGTVYAGAALVFAARWIGVAAKETDPAFRRSYVDPTHRH